MAHFAQLYQNNIVQQVIVNEDIVNWQEMPMSTS